MGKCNLVLAMMLTSLLVNGCTTKGDNVSVTTHDSYPSKKPQSVSLYTTTQHPNAAYRVIGVAKVSKYNMLGMQRRDATINSMMKKFAASIGGDGLIDVTQTDNEVQANVIAYQHILI
jgi:hypothetical protein